MEGLTQHPCLPWGQTLRFTIFSTARVCSSEISPQANMHLLQMVTPATSTKVNLPGAAAVCCCCCRSCCNPAYLGYQVWGVTP
jgi:hypothetical protein